MLDRFTFLLPLWAVLLSTLAYFAPQIFVPLKSSIIYLLTLVMLGMEITLKPADFAYLTHLKSIIAVGLLLQFTVTPLTAWLLSRSFAAMANRPGAVFSIWHNLSGSLLAAIWSRSAKRE